MKERLLNRPKSAGPNRMAQERPFNTITIRPKSVLIGQEGRSSTPLGRPKSGKSLSFQLCDGRVTPALSISTNDYRHDYKRDNRRVSKTPIPQPTFNRDGLTSAASSTRADSIRDTVRDSNRSPTPNILKDMEPAFFELQIHIPGLVVWRVESNSLRKVDSTEHGFFHEGNTYLILQINGNVRSLHYWIGSLSSETDAKWVENKAHELDKIVSNAQIFSREVQNFESSVFLRLFQDGIIYIEGKIKTGVTKASVYEKRLYVVSGRKYPRAVCVIPKSEYLQSDSTLILDGHPRLYVWLGKHSGYVQRTKAMRIARRMQHLQRKDRCHIVVIDEDDVQLNYAFKKKFDGPAFPSPLIKNKDSEGNETNETVSDKDTEVHLILHRISGDRVLYDMPEADKRPLHHCYLVTKDSYLLDRGPDKTLYMWVGTCAMEDEVNNSLKRAKTFSTHNSYPQTTSLCRIREDFEPVEFKRCFCDWRDRLSKEMSLTKRYSVANVGRALYSQSDKRTIATVKECWSEDTVGQYTGTTQVWVLNENKLEVWDHNGIFSNNKCYIILYVTADTDHPQNVLYYWMGCKSSTDDRDKIVQSCLEKDNDLEHSAVMVRVLDGKEPQHFMSALHNWMLVYDRDENTTTKKELQMFCVREFRDRGIRIQQVVPEWLSMNSSASFVVLSSSTAFLWFGKHSGSTERESAKDLLGVLCSSKMYSFEIVTDGKEPASLCKLLGSRQAYAEEFKEKTLERRPSCLIHVSEDIKTFTEIDEYIQEDLSGENMMLVDLYDQMFVWCGEDVSKTRRQSLFQIAKNYIRMDSAGRHFDDVALWFVSQRREPMAFIKHFPSWSTHEYSSRYTYECQRKKIRQDNAKIDINETMVDTGFLSQPKYSYKTLLKRDLPHDVDDANKHYHLKEKEFCENLKLSRQDFYRLPLWKQQQILKSARLTIQCTPRYSSMTVNMVEP